MGIERHCQINQRCNKSRVCGTSIVNAVKVENTCSSPGINDMTLQARRCNVQVVSSSVGWYL